MRKIGLALAAIVVVVGLAWYSVAAQRVDAGAPTTAKAGIAFPENDWLLYPAGDQYLANLGNPSQKLLDELAALRQQHLRAVADLLSAIDKGNVSNYLNHQFKCPK